MQLPKKTETRHLSDKISRKIEMEMGRKFVQNSLVKKNVWERHWTSWFHKIRGKSWPAEQLTASQEDCGRRSKFSYL